LNVITLLLPPLRKRREDIPLLAQHFLNRYAGLNNKKITGFDSPAMSYLINASWKGNVRELENTIERAVVLSNSPVITSGDLLPVRKSKTGKLDFGDTLLPLKEVERIYTEKVLNTVGGNVERAARLLGVSSRSLYRRNRKPLNSIE